MANRQRFSARDGGSMRPVLGSIMARPPETAWRVVAFAAAAFMVGFFLSNLFHGTPLFSTLWNSMVAMVSWVCPALLVIAVFGAGDSWGAVRELLRPSEDAKAMERAAAVLRFAGGLSVGVSVIGISCVMIVSANNLGSMDSEAFGRVVPFVFLCLLYAMIVAVGSFAANTLLLRRADMVREDLAELGVDDRQNNQRKAA